MFKKIWAFIVGFFISDDENVNAANLKTEEDLLINFKKWDKGFSVGSKLFLSDAKIIKKDLF